MNPQILNFIRKSWVIPTSVGVAAFASGLGIGYIFGRKTKSVEEAAEEIAEQLILDFSSTDFVRKGSAYNVINLPKVAEVDEHIEADPVTEIDKEEIQKKLEKLDAEAEAWQESRRKHPSNQIRGETPVMVNVFATEDDEWDYGVEIEKRDPKIPYIIHADEFFDNENGWEQTTLTYYEGDDILCDERDVPIYNYSLTVGELRFGHGSKDKNVVYIRNVGEEAEFEVIRDPGLYQVEVAGLQIEHQYEEDDLKHSKHPHKFYLE